MSERPPNEGPAEAPDPLAGATYRRTTPETLFRSAWGVDPPEVPLPARNRAPASPTPPPLDASGVPDAVGPAAPIDLAAALSGRITALEEQLAEIQRQVGLLTRWVETRGEQAVGQPRRRRGWLW